MKTHHLRKTLVTLFALALPLALCVTNISAQDLPANWQQLSAEDFANAVDKVSGEGTKGPVGNFDEKAVQKHAASLFVAIDLAQAATTEFPVALKLLRAGWGALDKTQRAAMRTALAARQDNWTGRPYVEVRSKVSLMEWVNMPFESISQEATRWLDAGGDVSTVWDKDLHYYAYYVVRDPKVVRGSFSIRWEGRVTAPQTGQYTFSISPINVNAVYRDYSVQQTMKVSVGGQEIIAATPEKWTAQSAPVQLTAGQPVALQVDVSVESPKLPWYALHANLSWEGPGVGKSIVPETRLKLSGSDDAGLRATYSWTKDGQAMTAVKVDKTIDFAWTAGMMIVSSTVTDWAWWKQMTPQYLDALQPAGGKVKLHPWMSTPGSSSAGLTSARRKAFLEMLLSRPTLLDPLDAIRAVRFYRSFRIGAEETALDVFGRWAARNANRECGMPYETHLPGIDLEERNAYQDMAVCVTQELPAHADRLRDEFLELPDGSCCLPVAYVLGYSYLGRDKFAEWLALLDAKLADEALVGDKRVNWLIARAHAQEIRLGSRNPYAIVKARIMDGRGWLDTAALLAQDADLKLRVTKQLAARLSATRKFDEARALLDEAVNSTPAGRAADITAWRASIDKFQAANAAIKVSRAESARQAYIDKLRERRDRAATAGNTAASDRYEALINSVDPQ